MRAAKKAANKATRNASVAMSPLNPKNLKPNKVEKTINKSEKRVDKLGKKLFGNKP